MCTQFFRYFAILCRFLYLLSNPIPGVNDGEKGTAQFHGVTNCVSEVIITYLVYLVLSN